MLRSESGRSGAGFSGSCAASMPAAAQEASVMGRPRSSTVTRSPLPASSSAVDNPMIPPPAMNISVELTHLLYGDDRQKNVCQRPFNLSSLSARCIAGEKEKKNDEQRNSCGAEEFFGGVFRPISSGAPSGAWRVDLELYPEQSPDEDGDTADAGSIGE